MVGECSPGGGFRGEDVRSCLATIRYGAASPLASAIVWDVVWGQAGSIVTGFRLN